MSLPPFKFLPRRKVRLFNIKESIKSYQSIIINDMLNEINQDVYCSYLVLSSIKYWFLGLEDEEFMDEVEVVESSFGSLVIRFKDKFNLIGDPYIRFDDHKLYDSNRNIIVDLPLKNFI